MSKNIQDEVILEIKGLKLWFKVYQGYSKVLDGVDLTVHKGEKVGIVGEAGCGKTTTVKSILGILPEGQYVIPEGEILYKGQRINGKISRELDREVTKSIQMIFQDPMASLNERAKVDYIVSEGLYAGGLKMSEAERAAREAELARLEQEREASQRAFDNQMMLEKMRLEASSKAAESARSAAAEVSLSGINAWLFGKLK